IGQCPCHPDTPDTFFEAPKRRMADDIVLILIVSLPFAGSLIAAFLPADARNAGAWLAGTVAFICLILSAATYPAVTAVGSFRSDIEWIPTLGLTVSLRMDGFAWLFAMLVSGIGLLVVLYARYYLSPEDPVSRFFSCFLAFMGAMLGIVVSGNLILLVIFWE